MVPNNSRQRNAPRPSVPVHAPYNFVPFSEKILFRYAGIEELPPHDRIDPALHTGEIHVTLRAETPVFVSDGDEEPHFFKGPDGKYQIPGSTVRGMVRENMQILGYGLVRPGEDLDDYQIYFREMAGARGGTRGDLKEYYQGVLDIKTEKGKTGKPVSTPRAVQAGYLFCENGTYWIRPVPEGILLVSRKDPHVAQFGSGDARTVPVSYQGADGTVTALYPAGRQGMKQGTLLFTGKSASPKPNHLYLFPQEDPQIAPVQVPSGDILSYRIDWEERKNSLKAYYDPDFWALPEEGKRKPVFFTRHEGHLYFGMSRFLRVGYRHMVSDGLPQHHREAASAMPLDYPSAILGFARGKQAYRSRVSFGGFVLQGKPKELPPVKTVLGQPKASFYAGYVEEGKNYNQDDFRLRGYKLYWLREKASAPSAEKENVASTLRPLDTGSVFRGVIRFKNLTDEELGLLLWCLRLEKGCWQSIGMGKPYGYGRMTLTIDSLREFRFDSLYSPEGLTGGAVEVEPGAIDRLIQAYDDEAAERLHLKKPKKRPSIRSREEIQDFFYLKSTLHSGPEVSYMELKEFKNPGTCLPDVASLRKKEQETQIEKEEQEKTEEDRFAALLAKFGRK